MITKLPAPLVVTALQLNQAIKNAINNDAVLSKLLVAKDGPSNTLVITSLIDGVFAADDLAMVVSSTAATATQESSVLTAYKTFTKNVNAVIADANTASAAAVVALNALNGVNGSLLATTTAVAEVQTLTFTGTENGTGTNVTIASTSIGGNIVVAVDNMTADQAADAVKLAIDAVGTINGNAVTTSVTGGVLTINYTVAAGNVTDIVVTPNGATNGITVVEAVVTQGASLGAIDGENSTVASDNTVTLGAGDDVAVLSTSGQSNDTLVFSGSFGKDTIVNFVDGAGAGADKLDFTAYLTTQKLVTGLTSTIAVNLNADNTAAVDANSVTILTTFAQGNGTDGIAGTADDHTFAGLTADNLLSSIKADALTTNDYANLVDATFNASALPAGIIGATYKSIVMIENDKNDGEYKVFELTANGTDFTAATLVGTIDFGDSLTLVEANNLVLA